uniref:Apple domain-containing protein n=1 Tax=Macrostomum lignano TaxID=282301 RepID=A0A1I8JP14_9PLAT
CNAIAKAPPSKADHKSCPFYAKFAKLAPNEPLRPGQTLRLSSSRLADPTAEHSSPPHSLAPARRQSMDLDESLLARRSGAPWSWSFRHRDAYLRSLGSPSAERPWPADPCVPPQDGLHHNARPPPGLKRSASSLIFAPLSSAAPQCISAVRAPLLAAGLLAVGHRSRRLRSRCPRPRSRCWGCLSGPSLAPWSRTVVYGIQMYCGLTYEEMRRSEMKYSNGAIPASSIGSNVNPGRAGQNDSVFIDNVTSSFELNVTGVRSEIECATACMQRGCSVASVAKGSKLCRMICIVEFTPTAAEFERGVASGDTSKLGRPIGCGKLPTWRCGWPPWYRHLRRLFLKYSDGALKAVADIVTCDETWVYCYEPERKCQSQVRARFQTRCRQRRFVRGREHRQANGPAHGDCGLVYRRLLAIASHDGRNGSVQSVQLPFTACYRPIEALGADGGSVSFTRGGNAAQNERQLQPDSGTVLRNAGGGGGSFVYTKPEETLLLAAGGGGGASNKGSK